MSDETVLKDITGNVIEPGDTVVYPQMSGRSVQIVLGKLLSYNGKTAQIERTEGARWGASYNRTRYRDKRTGKGIDPYASDKHWETRAHYLYTHETTGEVISEEEMNRRFPLTWGWESDRASRRKRQEFKGQYVPGVLKDYVEEYKDAPKPVTIHNVKNIVKVVTA
ncbi:hypothetical protein ACFOOK_26110 [Micromonospora krabiensis]|uniref:Uncharacterized protein n=1 Tax=Micromonospora krabiensis TaxID=307121 RepID=A0A1C3N5U3_9ACTN|nr:hypothetical protein [Micromonospora krabiensis]SBV27959.1 hypothetical protein GA0070620_3490 [Micromonospora krabiensis]